MKPGFSIFLLVAEEMSISAAARRAFVTQQCVSDHIHRLEQEYNAKLFERKPHLKLTQAGEIMLHTLRSVGILEQTMEKSLQGISSGTKGAFRVGISTSRAQIILPRVLPKYQETFPDVQISFYVNDTIVLEQQLLEGNIDLFLGVNTSQNPDFSNMSLADDHISLVISDKLLRQHFGNKDIQAFEHGAELSKFEEVPFSLYYSTGAVNKVISHYLETHRLQLTTNYHISDCDTHIALCASGICAALCPRMLLVRVGEHNAWVERARQLHIFPVQDFDEILRIDLVWHKHTALPLYMRIFMELVRDEVALLAIE